MRLIDAVKLNSQNVVDFQVFPEEGVPKYAILSHRWGDAEVTFQDLTDNQLFWRQRINEKSGYMKIRHAAAVAVDYQCQWLWCDTCCIDKTSSAELSEAINSMYRWYRFANLCFAYLADVSTEEVANFTKSVWFDRAWTLQELIAAPKLIFFDSSWRSMRNKHELAEAISRRTRIDKDVLTGSKRLEKFTVAQKMSWAADRQASRTEDVAYSLLGIFDVNMPMLYGEGKKAFVRLQEEIIQRNADQSTFVWFSDTGSKSLFASHPSDFRDCGLLQLQNQKKKAFAVNNLGLDIEMTLRPTGLNSYVAYMAVENGSPNNLASLNLEIDPETGYLCRTGASLKQPSERAGPQIRQTKRVTILRSGSSRYQKDNPPLFGFHVTNENNILSAINKWDPIQEWDLGQWSHGTNPNTATFSIPDGASASIAMLKLTIGAKTFLIQLAYDINFNPCVNFSDFTTDFYDRFRRRVAWGEEGETLFTWADSAKVNWTTNLRHVDAIFKDPSTGRSCWCAKAIDRQEFTARVPTTFTKPYTNVEVKFSTTTTGPGGPSTPVLPALLPTHQGQGQSQGHSPSLANSSPSYPHQHSRQPSHTPAHKKEWQFTVINSSSSLMPSFISPFNSPPSNPNLTSQRDPGTIEIINIKQDLDRQKHLMDIDEDEPSMFVRQGNYQDLQQDVMRRRGPLAARFVGLRTDTSPT